jgi:hypothetical protein
LILSQEIIITANQRAAFSDRGPKARPKIRSKR